MMNALQTIASDVLECLSQLFDYYLFAVRLWCELGNCNNYFGPCPLQVYKFFTVDLVINLCVFHCNNGKHQTTFYYNYVS